MISLKLVGRILSIFLRILHFLMVGDFFSPLWSSASFGRRVLWGFLHLPPSQSKVEDLHVVYIRLEAVTIVKAYVT